MCSGWLHFCMLIRCLILWTLLSAFVNCFTWVLLRSSRKTVSILHPASFLADHKEHNIWYIAIVVFYNDTEMLSSPARSMDRNIFFKKLHFTWGYLLKVGRIKYSGIWFSQICCATQFMFIISLHWSIGSKQKGNHTHDS